MKKMMIIAGLICAACVSQAASFRWSASGVKDVTGEAPFTGTASLYVIIDGVDTLVQSGYAMNSGAITSHVVSTDAVTVGSTYNFYYVMEDSDGNLFNSGTKAAKAQQSSTAALGFGSQGTWEPVPEPTSGLLLLLGVAGLALKRKRA